MIGKLKSKFKQVPAAKLTSYTLGLIRLGLEKMQKLILTLLTALSFHAVAHDGIPIIFDTDFAMPPQDDALALMLAVQSQELDILGITTIAGNDLSLIHI